MSIWSMKMNDESEEGKSQTQFNSGRSGRVQSRNWCRLAPSPSLQAACLSSCFKFAALLFLPMEFVCSSLLDDDNWSRSWSQSQILISVNDYYYFFRLANNFAYTMTIQDRCLLRCEVNWASASQEWQQMAFLLSLGLRVSCLVQCERAFVCWRLPLAVVSASCSHVSVARAFFQQTKHTLKFTASSLLRSFCAHESAFWVSFSVRDPRSPFGGMSIFIIIRIRICICEFKSLVQRTHISERHIFAPFSP